MPADIDFCITVNKSEILKESPSLSKVQSDSLYTKIKSKIPLQAFALFSTAGMNPLGDLAVFGKGDTYHLAWVANNKPEFEQLIVKESWKVIKHKTYDEVQLSDKLFLLYSWPMLLLTNKSRDKENAFFNKGAKKLKKRDLFHDKTKDCMVFGYFDPSKLMWRDLQLIPQKGKAFIGMKMGAKEIELLLVQPQVKLEGKMGTMQVEGSPSAFFSWPLTLNQLTEFKPLPDTVLMHLTNLIKKPVHRVYGEILDTFSVSDRRITYDMDAEFKLTQKITFVYKTYPGCYLEFYKNTPDVAVTRGSQKTGLGLDILKLTYFEKDNKYILTSDSTKIKPKGIEKKVPNYFVYVNIDKLKTDPFLKSYMQGSFKELLVYADALEKGSVFTFKLKR